MGYIMISLNEIKHSVPNVEIVKQKDYEIEPNIWEIINDII